MFLKDYTQDQVPVALHCIDKEVFDHKPRDQSDSQLKLTCSRVLTTHRGLVTKIVAVPAPAAAATLAPKVIL
jgi:hypothetical protein